MVRQTPDPNLKLVSIYMDSIIETEACLAHEQYLNYEGHSGKCLTVYLDRETLV